MKKALLTLIFGALLMPLVQAQSVQKVLIEEFTGAWCGYCPDGAYILDDILTNNPNTIGVSQHNSDGMQTATGSLIQNFYAPAFPQATINRSSAPISRGSWAGAVTTALQATPVVAVSIDSAGYNVSTRTLKVKVKASFLTDYTGAMRMNVFLTEDGVTGTGSLFDQVNYFNSTSGSPFFGLGNPIVGYVHNHIFRSAGGGAWGTGNVIPSVVTAGQDFWHTYTIVLGSTWDINNMHIVGMVSMFSGSLQYQRAILNSEEVPFSFATSVFGSPAANGLEMEIYPNPMQSRSTIGFQLPESGHLTLEVYNLTGQKVRVLADDVTNSGMHSMYWDGMDQFGSAVANGVYIMRLNTDGGSLSKRIVVNR